MSPPTELVSLVSSLVAVFVLAGVYLAGYHVHARKHQRAWVSAAAGVSTAYVFVDLLPGLAEQQAALDSARRAAAPYFAEQIVYLMALLGFVFFYGLDQMGLLSRRYLDDRRESVFYGLHIGAFAVYFALIGYFIVRSSDGSLPWLGLYTLAMALHLLVVDHSLRREYGAEHDRQSRWILAPALIVGWGVGLLGSPSSTVLAGAYAFVGGGVIINNTREELPKEREGKFWPFVVGAIAYALLLLAV